MLDLTVDACEVTADQQVGAVRNDVPDAQGAARVDVRCEAVVDVARRGVKRHDPRMGITVEVVPVPAGVHAPVGGLDRLGIPVGGHDPEPGAC